MFIDDFMVVEEEEVKEETSTPQDDIKTPRRPQRHLGEIHVIDIAGGARKRKV